MNNWVALREWALAVAVLLMTALATATVRSFLKRVGRSRQMPLITELAPALSNLMYIVGLRVFAEVAPLNPKLDSWLDSGIYIFAVLIVLGMIRRAAMIGIGWTTSRSSNSSTLQQGFIPLLKNLTTLFVFFAGAIMILKRFNYDVMSLLTALGVGSLAVGLAAKDTLSNMISGFTLIIDRNVRPGDRINLAGNVGDVEEIGLRSTKVRTADGNTLIVPNSDLVNIKILNLSMPSREGVANTQIKVPYDVSFPRVRDVCLETIDQVGKRNKNRGKWCNLTNLTEGYQSVAVGFWLNEIDEAGAALTEFHEKLLARFQSEQIPFYMPPVQVAADRLKN
jgi:MscS family membrane protein